MELSRLSNRPALGSAVSAVALAAAALGLAGCGAGQITQTATQQAAVNGAYGQVRGLELRDAALVNPDKRPQAYVAGASAPLTLSIVNRGTAGDMLLAVSSPLARDVSLDGDTAVLPGRTLVVGPAQNGEPAERPAGESPAPGPVSSSAAVAPTQPNQSGAATIRLQQLQSVVWAGQTVPVTFTFRDAGPVTLQLPMAAPTVALPEQQAEVPAGEGEH